MKKKRKGKKLSNIFSKKKLIVLTSQVTESQFNIRKYSSHTSNHYAETCLYIVTDPQLTDK